MKRALVLSAVIAARAGCGAAEAASDPRATQLTYQPWAKICVNRPDGNSDCFISSGAKGACQPSGGGIAVWIRDGKQRSLSVNLVTKRMLDGTLAVRIDQGVPIAVPDPNCGELGCRGKLDIDTDFIEGLKHARAISVEAMTRDHQTVSLPFALAGFAEAFDGPAGGPPKVAEMSSDELKERSKRSANLPPCE
ncbi:invasion associated locus B family protein [Afipia sp. GAS231]|uniref:invasion associated locus B family protein n=1 Tax=Afipia sp. GAS231 TaxID=1882747 RepID=UPI0012F8F5B4|nr:invasion associated locus B family protein [Afipia sp. GAS231]